MEIHFPVIFSFLLPFSSPPKVTSPTESTAHSFFPVGRKTYVPSNPEVTTTWLITSDVHDNCVCVCNGESGSMNHFPNVIWPTSAGFKIQRRPPESGDHTTSQFTRVPRDKSFLESLAPLKICSGSWTESAVYISAGTCVCLHCRGICSPSRGHGYQLQKLCSECRECILLPASALVLT